MHHGDRKAAKLFSKRRRKGIAEAAHYRAAALAALDGSPGRMDACLAAVHSAAKVCYRVVGDGGMLKLEAESWHTWI